MSEMTFEVTNKSGHTGTIEVYYDEQTGCEPGWCWRGQGEDSITFGGDTIEDVSKEDAEFALQCAKSAWGL